MTSPIVVLQGRGSFAGQELYGQIEPDPEHRWHAVVRVGGLGIYVWLAGPAPGIQVGSRRGGFRLTPASVGLARCRLGLGAREGYPCPCLRCARDRMRRDALQGVSDGS